MLCPHCSHNDSKVIDSRDSGDGIRRRRQCLECGLRYTTYERVYTRALQVIKRDERREDFDRDKLWASVAKACANRPLPTGSIEKAVHEIEAELVDTGRSEIRSRAVGESVMEKLKQMDRVVYIRFASVYRDFKDIETFKEEIDSLLEPAVPPREPSNQLSFLEDEDDLPGRRRRRGRPRQQPHPDST